MSGKEPETDKAWLKRVLGELDMSGSDLARHLDVRPETVWRWRRGEVPIPKVVRLYIELLLDARWYRSRIPEL